MATTGREFTQSLDNEVRPTDGNYELIRKAGTFEPPGITDPLITE
jgi:hypothetical protein